MSDVAQKSLFYDFLARYAEGSFETYMADAVADEDYLNWNGYVLPYVFTDEAAEYAAVRQGCALFDATPANKYRITGPDAGALLDYMTTRAMSALAPMRATYAIWCTPDGMLNDDAMLLKLGEQDYLLMAAEVDHTDYLAELADRFDDVTVTDESALWAGLAVQGARSAAVLAALGLTGVEQLRPFHVAEFPLADGRVVVARVGFTGDLGYEVWFERSLAPAVMAGIERAEAALGLQVGGYGLTTIQLCRMESGMIVPGWDTAQTFEDRDLERSPLELGLAWNVDLDREGDFVGKAALLAERANGSRFVMTGFEVDADCELTDGTELLGEVDGEWVAVGTLPSVSWSHERGHWIGLASLRSPYASLAGGQVEVDGERYPARLVSLPFVTVPHRRQVPAPL